MKKNVLPYVNSIIVIAFIASYALFEYADRQGLSEQDGSQSTTRSVVKESPVKDRDRVALAGVSNPDLLKRVDALELRVGELKSQLAQARKEMKEAAPTLGEKAGVKGEDSGLAMSEGIEVSKAALKKLVKAQIKEVNEEAKKEWAAKAKNGGRKSKNLSAVSEELNLSANQEQDIGNLIEGLEKEAYKTLFKVKDEELNTLLQQLQQAKTDPKLKSELREKMMINWTKNSKDISVLYIKFDSQLRKILPADQVQKFYSYKVKRDNSPYPDLEEYFKEPEEKK
ncbi:MAG: hypothetical protein P1V97_10055 [Planctomycetota bacterium]|nr:hypothetical protein [Planctomycetota bacterium]